MLTVVTGAAGFVGQAVVREMIVRGHPGKVRLLDRSEVDCPAAAFESRSCDLTNLHDLRAALAGATHVIHLAALPGGASETDPRASRLVNLDATLDLIDLLATMRVRLLHASSIAVLGSTLPEIVDDATPANPGMTYGAHKRMSEIAIADAVRRGDLDALALRLPGIVARPRTTQGFGSAFVSDLFWAIQAGQRYTVPVSADGWTWLLSARQCAGNLLHALSLRACSPIATMPALHVRIGDLVGEVERQSGRSAMIDFAPDPRTQAIFASYPPLSTATADALGLCHDGDLTKLVSAVLGQEACS